MNVGVGKRTIAFEISRRQPRLDDTLEGSVLLTDHLGVSSRIVRQHQGMVFGPRIPLFCAIGSLAEELSQEVFLNLHQKPAVDKVAPSTWTFWLRPR